MLNKICVRVLKRSWRGFLLVLLLGNSLNQGLSQQWDLGVKSGFITDPGFESSGVNIASVLEFNVLNDRLSFAITPGVIFARSQNAIGSFPVYARFRFGEVWQFSPSLGGFYWTTKRWGGSAGLVVERSFNERLKPIISAHYLRVYYRYKNLSNVGDSYYTTRNIPALNFAAGIKYRIN